MEIMTKAELIAKLKEIRSRGWINNARPGNQGGVGNTMEDLLGIEENNLPIPNASEWELKCQRITRGQTKSLTTIMHLEPSPRACNLVAEVLLPLYGWSHKSAGSKYPVGEMSFRQTINSLSLTDRGFCFKVDESERKLVVSFDASKVDIKRHKDWLDSVERRIGLAELNPQPYWGFRDLFPKMSTKLKNCFYIMAETRHVYGDEQYHYKEIWMLENFSEAKFLEECHNGNVLIDFDARTGHNHGTKFRLRKGTIASLYEKHEII